MKITTIALFLSLLTFPFVQTKAQNGLEASVHLGIPTEDIEDPVNLVYGIDFSYYFINVAEILNLGLTGGYINFNGEQQLSSSSLNLALPDAGFFRAGVAGKLHFGSSIYFELDLGYSTGLDDIEGGVYYQPKVGFNSGRLSFFVYYQKMYTDTRFPNYSSVGVGTSFHF